MKLICILFIMIDLLLLYKTLNHKEGTHKEEPTPPTYSVTFTQDRPRRVYMGYINEEEPSLEELGEELRIKFKERLKDWEEGYLWNKEDNLRRFRLKNGITLEGLGNTNNRNNLEEGLFSLKVV